MRVVGASAIRSVLDLAMESGSTGAIGYDWHSEFGSQSAAVADWLKHLPNPSPSILEDLTADLNPTDSAVLSLGSSIWLSTAEHSASLGTRSNTFLFVLGCQNPAGEPWELVSYCFERVHRAAGFETLGYQSWQLLRDVLPVLGSSKDWDACERLRRLLVSRFQSFGWPTAAFLRALENPNTLERALQYIVSQRELRGFAAQMLEDLQAGRAVLASGQAAVFDPYWKKLRRS